MEIDKDKVLGNCGKNLEQGRAVATGIGIFVAVVKDGKILFRIRREKGSLYDKDLSGNWELVGGGVEIEDFEEHYLSAIFHAIQRELPEESGLIFNTLTLPISMLPAWLCKNNLIDLAFVVLLTWKQVMETDEFRSKLSKGEVKFFSKSEVEKLNIVSPGMRYMVQQAFSVIDSASSFASKN